MGFAVRIGRSRCGYLRCLPAEFRIISRTRDDNKNTICPSRLVGEFACASPINTMEKPSSISQSYATRARAAISRASHSDVDSMMSCNHKYLTESNWLKSNGWPKPSPHTPSSNNTEATRPPTKVVGDPGGDRWKGFQSGTPQRETTAGAHSGTTAGYHSGRSQRETTAGDHSGRPHPDPHRF